MFHLSTFQPSELKWARRRSGNSRPEPGCRNKIVRIYLPVECIWFLAPHKKLPQVVIEAAYHCC